MERKEYLMTGEDTIAVKGLAVILMMAHHLLAFPDRVDPALRPVFLLERWGGPLEGLPGAVTLFFKICVPMFCFLAGFGQYRSWLLHGRKFNTLNRIKRFYCSYWKVFLLVVPVALIFFANQPSLYSTCQVYELYRRFDLSLFLQSFFGVDAVYCGEWWFVRTWIVCTATLPVWAALTGKRSPAVQLSAFAALAVLNHLGTAFSESSLLRVILGQNAYGLSFYLGVIMAEDERMEKMMKQWADHGLNRVWINLAVILGLMFISAGRPDAAEITVLSSPVLVMLSALLIGKCGTMRRVLILYGKHSTNIWLFHTFLCYYFLSCQRLIYWPRLALADLLWFMAVCLAISGAVNLFWEWIGRAAKRITSGGASER